MITIRLGLGTNIYLNKNIVNAFQYGPTEQSFNASVRFDSRTSIIFQSVQHVRFFLCSTNRPMFTFAIQIEYANESKLL